MIEDTDVQEGTPAVAAYVPAPVVHTPETVLARFEAILEAVGHIPSEVSAWVKAEVAKIRSEL